MKKNLFIAFALLTLLFAVSGCGQQSGGSTAAKTTVLKVGATAVPHAEILAAIKPELAKEGIDLQIVEMTDYVRPNLAVADKELDANFFQHIPYLEKFAGERKLALAYTAKVHIEPMGIYSRKVKDLAQVPAGAKIAIPNDPTNGGRALALLAKANLLTLKDGVGVHATAQDIVANPKQLTIVELEAPQLPRSLDDVALAVINTNYALEAKLVPTKDALLLEQKDSPYANILTVRSGDEQRPEIKKLTAALTSDTVRKFIEEKYQGAVVPAF